MPLLFFIDKDMLDDPACRNVEDVVLSYTFFRYVAIFFCPKFSFSTRELSARRNEHGQLEPDAEESVVQNSLGFGGYEHAPKAESRNTAKDSSPTGP
jgi:cytochrome c oxidase assembly protein subunit 11